MTFTITPRRLDDDARRAIWSKGFPAGMQTGFHIYFGDAKPDNIGALCLDNDWWEAGDIEYSPSPLIKDWIADNYPELGEDMKCLAKFLFLTRGDSYHKRADYVTRLWEEQGDKLIQLMYLEYIPRFLARVIPGVVSRDILDTIGICWLSSDFPNNLPASLARLAALGIDNDMQEFTFWLDHQYGIGWAIDEFLGLLLRSFMDELDFEDDPAVKPADPDAAGKVAFAAPEVN